MGCNCGKNKTPPTGMNAARRQEETKAAEAKAREANISTKRIGPAMTGKTQSFTLRTVSGTTQTFGSALEARAAQARHGGTLLP